MKFKSPITPLLLLTFMGSLFILVRWQIMGLEISQFSSLEETRKLKSVLTFGFLLWNIFLAWLPLLFAYLFAASLKSGRSLFRSGSLILLWLIFLPNCPYILTDLLHLKWRHPVPHWYDLLLFISFAWTGWQLGIASLIKIFESLSSILSERWSMAVVVLAIILCGPGIYLGRVLRYNSWDLLHQPQSIIADMLEATFLPWQTPGAGMIWMLVPFLLLTFWSQITTTSSWKRAF